MSFSSNCYEVSLSQRQHYRSPLWKLGQRDRDLVLGIERGGGVFEGFGAVIIFIFIKFYLKVVTEPLTSAVSVQSLSPSSAAISLSSAAKHRLSQEEKSLEGNREI